MSKPNNACSTLNIIAGKWRRQKIEFPDTKLIRPTPNRVRETLFNWLMTLTPESICLDAFAGSGALSFEALSRGAKHVIAFEKDPSFAKQLHQNAQKFATPNLHIETQDFFLAKTKLAAQQFNIIFLDPPFQQNLLLPALNLLNETQCLAKEHRIYFEVEKSFDLSTLPNDFAIHKHQLAGQVKYGLLIHTDQVK